MLFRENLNRICKEKGTTLTAVVKSLGISSSKVTAINHGSIPSEGKLHAFAKALDCSVMDFFEDKETDVKSSARPENADEDDILRIYRNLSRRNKHEFMAMVYDFESKNK